MFKLFIVLAICYISYTQAFQCEFPCALNAECTAEDHCTCKQGYINIISEEDGLPHCERQGTEAETTQLLLANKLDTTTISSVISSSTQEDRNNDLVDDNGELLGDYRYQRDLQELRETNKIGNFPQMSLRGLLPHQQDHLQPKSFDGEDDNGELLGDYQNQRDVQELWETNKIGNFPQMSLRGLFPNQQDQLQSETFNEEEMLVSESTSENSETADTSMSTNEMTDETPTSAAKEDTEGTTSTLSTLKAETTPTVTTEPIINVYVERIAEKKFSVFGKYAVEKFYNLLACLCMFLAFLFIMTVIFGCVKL